MTNFQRTIELITKQIVKNLFKIWSWDPGSGIRKKPIPDPGSRGQKGTGSGIPDPDPQHWNIINALIFSYLTVLLLFSFPKSGLRDPEFS